MYHEFLPLTVFFNVGSGLFISMDRVRAAWSHVDPKIIGVVGMIIWYFYIDIYHTEETAVMVILRFFSKARGY